MSSSSIQEFLEGHAERSKLLSAIAALSLAPTTNTSEWAQRVSAVAAVTKSELEWLNQDDRMWLQHAVVSYMKKALTEFYPTTLVPPDDMKSALTDFTDWVARQDDRFVLNFVWAVMESFPRRGWTTAWAPVRWLDRSGRLSRDIAYKYLELALTFRDEAESIYSWPDERWELADWKRDSQVYFSCTSHPSYVVRAWATKVLGRLYLNCARLRKADTPPIAEILAWVQDQERINTGIAGAFLDGASWSIHTEEWSTLSADFDLRSWFLDTLRRGKREPDVPHVQTIEFYAHEYFDRDEEAIREMLRMGRRHLAVMTATERYDAIDRMAGVLQEMAKSDDADVARAIQEYLRVRAPHAGMQYMPEAD